MRLQSRTVQFAHRRTDAGPVGGFRTGGFGFDCFSDLPGLGFGGEPMGFIDPGRGDDDSLRLSRF